MKRDIPRAMSRSCINHALAATLLASGLTYEEAAKQTGAKHAQSLRSVMSKQGISKAKLKKLPIPAERVTNVILRVASEAGKRVRESMAGILDKQVDALSQVPAIPSPTHIQAVAVALEPLARTAKIVHDWGSDNSGHTLLFGSMDAVETQQVVELESEPRLIQAPNPEPTGTDSTGS